MILIAVLKKSRL